MTLLSHPPARPRHHHLLPDRSCADFEVSDESLGLNAIEEAGPRGHYLWWDHTARHFRQEHWEPRVWSRQMISAWADEGKKLDVDRGADIYRALLPKLDTESRLSRSEEKAIIALIRRAEADRALSG